MCRVVGAGDRAPSRRGSASLRLCVLSLCVPSSEHRARAEMQSAGSRPCVALRLLTFCDPKGATKPRCVAARPGRGAQQNGGSPRRPNGAPRTGPRTPGWETGPRLMTGGPGRGGTPTSNACGRFRPPDAHASASRRRTPVTREAARRPHAPGRCQRSAPRPSASARTSARSDCERSERTKEGDNKGRQQRATTKGDNKKRNRRTKKPLHGTSRCGLVAPIARPAESMCYAGHSKSCDRACGCEQ